MAAVVATSRTHPSMCKLIEVAAIPASAQQSDVKIVEEAMAKKIGSYVYYSRKSLGRGQQARVYRCLNLSDNKDYVSTHAISACILLWVLPSNNYIGCAGHPGDLHEIR